MLPYFRRAESFRGGGDAYRGHDGPLATSRGLKHNPLYDAFIEAGRQAGYPVSADLNGERQEGFGRLDMTVKDGVRWSTANAYLRPAMKRPNLAVVTHALATRIAFDGRRAVGVHYRRGGREHLATGAARGDPQRRIDQFAATAQALGSRPRGGAAIARDRRRRRPAGRRREPAGPSRVLFPGRLEAADHALWPNRPRFARGLVGLQWLTRGRGLGASNHFEAGGFIRSRAGVRYPDIQFHFLPMAVAYDGSSLAREHGFQAHVGPMRSKSRGWVRLASRDPAEPPKIRFNYMSHPDDWEEMRACVRLTREIFAQKAFGPYRGREIQPGESSVSDEAIDAFVRDHVESAYHPSCTCKMGSRERSARGGRS